MLKSEPIFYPRAIRLMANPYDLVLLDIELKGQCGLVLMDVLIEKRMDTGVIVVTGQHSESYAITALKKGAIDYIKKPFDPDELIESVNNVLKRQRKRRKLELLNHTVQASSAGIAIGVSGGEIVFTNPAYRQLANNGDGNWETHDSSKAHGDVVIDEEIHQALRTGLSWRGDANLIDSQGNSKTVYKLVDPIPEKVGGETYGVSLICCDLTAQRQKEYAVAKSRERYRKVVDSQRDFLYRLNSDLLLTFVNQTYASFSGKTPRSMIGLPITDAAPVSTHPVLLKALNSVRSGARPIEIELMVADDGNGAHWQHWRFEGIYDKEGRLTELQGVGRDVTGNKSVERESEELKQTLARVKRLSGILPICSSCKRIRDENGSWIQIEKFIENSSDAEFSHGICPACAHKLYPELYE